ncbi:MAG: flavin reductase family protein [Oscillospiraceae bacterium]|nr:flavin reductase family protein [Oscillospiraceae bacterium]
MTQSFSGFTENPVRMIRDDWALLSAGTPEKWNAMTVSWGGVGHLWNKDVAFVFVRPQRYTLELMDANACFALSFFGDRQGRAAEILTFCGKNSGRDVDKSAALQLAPISDQGAVYPSEAKRVFVCRKLFRQRIDPVGFIDAGIAANYPGQDYHVMFAGEILRVIG